MSWMYDKHFWFVFGVSQDKQRCDIADENKDVLVDVPLELSEAICNAHNAALDDIEREIKEMREEHKVEVQSLQEEIKRLKIDLHFYNPNHSCFD